MPNGSNELISNILFGGRFRAKELVNPLLGPGKVFNFLQRPGKGGLL
jgi:hypothetical protein